jgi:hypothetical protein
MSSENENINTYDYQEIYSTPPRLSRSYKAYCSKCRDSCYINNDNKEGTCSTCSTCNNS